MMIAPIQVVTAAAKQVSKKCAIEGCTSLILEGKGFVPAIPDLYKAVRGTGDNPEYPLTQTEIYSQEMCFSCRRKTDAKTFPTEGTLRLMMGRVAANLRKIEAADKAKAWAERMARQNRPRVHHTRVGEDMLDTIATSAKWAERLESRKKHKRLPAAERRRLAETRGSRPFASIKPEKKGKKKDQGGGKKGRK